MRTAVRRRPSMALTRCGGRVGALDNHCPHQGGPLGEGSIEGGLLRCPWHGYDYDPITGKPPAGFADAPVAYPVEDRADGTSSRCRTRATPPQRVRRAGRDAGRLGRGHSLRHGRPPRTSGSPRRCGGPRNAGSCATSGSGTRGAAAFAASAYGKHLRVSEACRTYLDQLRTTITALGAVPTPTLSDETVEALIAAFSR